MQVDTFFLTLLLFAINLLLINPRNIISNIIMLLNINATRALSFVFYDIKSKRISHRHSCNVYMRSLCGSCPAGVASAARPRTATHDHSRLWSIL